MRIHRKTSNGLMQIPYRTRTDSVGEPEQTLRYQNRHMFVCAEWVWMIPYQAGWHRRRILLLSLQVKMQRQEFFVS